MTHLETWATSAKALLDCAMGRTPADMVTTSGAWVNVHFGEVLQRHDIAIHFGWIAFVGPDATHIIGETTEVI